MIDPQILRAMECLLEPNDAQPLCSALHIVQFPDLGAEFTVAFSHNIMIAVADRLPHAEPAALPPKIAKYFPPSGASYTVSTAHLTDWAGAVEYEAPCTMCPTEGEKCVLCGGSGTVCCECPECWDGHDAGCKDCAGTGKEVPECTVCRGKGTITPEPRYGWIGNIMLLNRVLLARVLAGFAQESSIELYNTHLKDGPLFIRGDQTLGLLTSVTYPDFPYSADQDFMFSHEPPTPEAA